MKDESTPQPPPRTPLPIYQVDAFTDQLFRGNPAAVCPLPRWLPDETLQAIARENALPETAFFVATDGDEAGRGPDMGTAGDSGTSHSPSRGPGTGKHFAIRWFTPDVEIDLCGHATLASAHVIARHLHPAVDEIRFQSQSGELRVRIDGDWIVLDFPSRPPVPADAPDTILQAMGVTPHAVLKSRDWVLVYDDAEVVQGLKPDERLLAQLAPGGTGLEGIIATAPGSEGLDFVSRFFVPGGSIFEDPVTGSAHCTLTPYWARRLGRSELQAAQCSARGGRLRCHDQGERVLIAGQALTYLEGVIRV